MTGLLKDQRQRAVTFQAVAMFAVLAAEFVASRQAAAASYGEYAYVRQLILPVSAVFAFGLDSSLIRADVGSVAKSELRILAAMLGGLSGVVVLIAIGSTGAVPIATTGVLAALGAAFFTILWIESGWFRSQREYFSATLRIHSPRFVGALWIICIAIASDEVSSAGLIAGTTAVSGFLALTFWRRSGTVPEGAMCRRADVRRRLFTLAKGGRWFLVASVTLASLDFVDLEALRSVSDSATIGTYAAARVSTLMPFVGLASVVGFVLMPEIRHSGASRRLMLKLVAGTGVVSLLGSLTFLAVNTQLALLPEAFPLTAGILLLGTGGMRLMSVVYSAIVGALAPTRLLAHFGMWAALSLVVEWALVVALPFAPVMAAATGQMAGTGIRTAAGIWIAWKLVRAVRPQGSPHPSLAVPRVR